MKNLIEQEIEEMEKELLIEIKRTNNFHSQKRYDIQVIIGAFKAFLQKHKNN